MKFIRIFLLVLIIIGIVLLATQKIWVPKLVDRIISHEGYYVITPDAKNNTSAGDIN